MTIVLKITCILCFTLLGLAVIGNFGHRRTRAVKTVTGWANECAFSFDDKVNAAIAEGWRVTRLVCMTERGETRLIAFLEK